MNSLDSSIDNTELGDIGVKRQLPHINNVVQRLSPSPHRLRPTRRPFNIQLRCRLQEVGDLWVLNHSISYQVTRRNIQQHSSLTPAADSVLKREPGSSWSDRSRQR